MIRSAFKVLSDLLLGVSKPGTPQEPEPLNNKQHFNHQANNIVSTRRADQRKIVAGSIHILNLEALKRELGAGWECTPDTVYAVIEKCLKQRLGPQDTFVRQGDMFVLCFADPDRIAVERRMNEIAAEAKALLSTLAPPVRIAHDVTDIVFADAPEEAILDTIAASLRRVRQDAEEAARKWRTHLRKNLAVQYRPVWSPKKGMVVIHRASLDEETAQRALEQLDSLSSPDEMLDVLFDLDCVVFGRAVASLHSLVSVGGRTQLIVPVQFNSINIAARRKTYLDLCEDCPAAYRRYLLFEIRDVPAGTPRTRIMEHAAALKRFAHGILVELSSANAIELLIEPGAAIMGVATQADQFLADSADFQSLLKRFVAEARSRNLRVFLHGARTIAVVRAASAAGIDFIDGAPIANCSREPKTIYPWQLKSAPPNHVITPSRANTS